MRARFTIVFVLILLLPACVGDGDATTTTSVATPTTTTAPPTTTTSVASNEPIDLNDYPIPTNAVCFYLPGYISLPADEVAAAESALNSGGIPATQVTPEVVLANTTDPGEGIPGNSGDINEVINQVLGFLEVTGEPLQVSLALQAQGFQVSPIHLLGFTNHIRFQPGTDPSPVTGLELPDVTSTPLDGGVVAVVDSGIAAPDNRDDPIPDWFYGADNDGQVFVQYEPLDEEALTPENPASHGTFVAGLIRQVAPTKMVSFASARLANTGTAVITPNTEGLPPGLAPTSEIQVAEAMARLILRHADKPDAIQALNLSLGTYTCDPETDLEMVTIRAMSELWLETFEASDIFAAAGNEAYQSAATPMYIPFWPAAFSSGLRGRFHAVAAVDRSETEIVWIDKEPEPVSTQGRPWVTDWGPGADLVNLSGGVVSDPSLGDIPALVCWSGSSFATGVASAQFTQGTSPSKPDFGAADGLTYVEPEGNEVVTVGLTSFGAQPCDHDASR